MIRKVLYPTDFSHASESGIAMLRNLRELGTEEVFVLHAIDLNKILGPVSGIDIPAVINDYERETEQNLERFADMVRREGLKVNALQPRIGEPSSVICETAEEVEADMIVIPSQGKGFIAGILLGSVSEGVVKRSRKPVLVLKFRDHQGEQKVSSIFETIAVGFDFSERSEKMLNFVSFFSESKDCRKVILIHVLERKAELNEESMKRLKEIEDSFKENGVDVETVIESGTPYKEVVRISEQKNATMTAIASSGEGFMKSLLGGTAYEVVRKSRIPVFVYKE